MVEGHPPQFRHPIGSHEDTKAPSRLEAQSSLSLLAGRNPCCWNGAKTREIGRPAQSNARRYARYARRDAPRRRRFAAGRNNFRRHHQRAVDDWVLYDNSSGEPALLEMGELP